VVAALEADASVIAAIRGWDKLSVPEQVPFLRQVFDIETGTLGITPPELVIGEDVKPGAAYFDFDPDKGGTGRVLLNTKALAQEKNPYVSLALLIHETRHSAQFQLPSKTFDAAFRAQKAMTGKLTFCDFMTLLNEYEAFQFGNYVVGKVTAWNVRMPDMGTFASQYDEHGQLKIDLIALGARVGAAGLLDAFNAAEKAQYDLLHGT